MEQTLILLSWIIYSLMEGVREAKYWHLKPLGNKWKSEHVEFTIQRSAVVLVLFTINPYWLIICPLLFPFLHDGAYYEHRRALSENRIYQKGFLDHSKTSRAILTKYFTFPARTICFLSGLTLFTVLLIKGIL